MAVFSSFGTALLADHPAPDKTGNANLYGWLIGSWDMDAVRHLAPGNIRKSKGEIHFGWILEGRAIQDVWYIPGQAGEAPPLCGTTLRIYDPDLDAWHIIWVDPIGQKHLRQLGKANAGGIVQEGRDSSGTLLRWRFTEIASDSFHWIGERSDGANWILQVEFFARRRRD
jgi:hypothetical protein